MRRTITTAKVRALVNAVRSVMNSLDDEDLFPSSVVVQRHIDIYYLCDTSKLDRIGGEDRKRLAKLLRLLRKNSRFRKRFRKALRTLLNRVAKNPKRFRHIKEHQGTRKTLHVVTRKATPAKRHRDCAYCGGGWDAGKICGVCKEAGIDGKLIRGTEARPETTYTHWS